MAVLISLFALLLVGAILRFLAGGLWPDRRADLDTIRRLSKLGDRR
ncbi:hypothetical protein AB0I72_27630 [Nocardiopsis sp. NPDC049922]